MKLARARRGVRFSGAGGLMVQKPNHFLRQDFFLFFFLKVFVGRKGCTSSACHFISAVVIAFMLSQKSPGHLQRQVPTLIMRKLRGDGVGGCWPPLFSSAPFLLSAPSPTHQASALRKWLSLEGGVLHPSKGTIGCYHTEWVGVGSTSRCDLDLKVA